MLHMYRYSQPLPGLDPKNISIFSVLKRAGLTSLLINTNAGYMSMHMSTYYLNSKTEVRWGSALKCHLGTALPKLPNPGLWWGQGATGRSSVLIKTKS